MDIFPYRHRRKWECGPCCKGSKQLNTSTNDYKILIKSRIRNFSRMHTHSNILNRLCLQQCDLCKCNVPLEDYIFVAYPRINLICTIKNLENMASMQYYDTINYMLIKYRYLRKKVQKPIKNEIRKINSFRPTQKVQ